MKIALVVPGFSAYEGDWCIPAHTNLARRLARAHEVHVFTLRYPHRRDVYSIGDALVHSLGGAETGGIAIAGLWRQMLAVITQEHRRTPFAVIHSIFGSEAGVVAVIAGKWLRVPSVVSFVGGELVGLSDIVYGADLVMRRRWMNTFILRFADRLFGGSRQVTRQAEGRVSLARRKKIQTLPLGIDTRMFTPPSQVSSDHPPRLVNVGSLLPVKDQATLLHAFARFRRLHPAAQLSIAGGGPLQGELRELAGQLGIQESMSWCGELNHDQMPGLYHHADMFVQASRHEGEGIALLEAGACGVALCGTNVGALSDLAEQEGAIAVEPHSVNALARAMQQAHEQRTVLGRRACELIRRDYDLDSICTQLIEIYSRLTLSSNKTHVANLTPSA